MRTEIENAKNKIGDYGFKKFEEAGIVKQVETILDQIDGEWESIQAIYLTDRKHSYTGIYVNADYQLTNGVSTYTARYTDKNQKAEVMELLIETYLLNNNPSNPQTYETRDLVVEKK